MLQEATAERTKRPSSDRTPNMYSEVFGRRGRNPLPPKETALPLVQG